jgi:hypothetical protein
MRETETYQHRVGCVMAEREQHVTPQLAERRGTEHDRSLPREAHGARCVDLEQCARVEQTRKRFLQHEGLLLHFEGVATALRSRKPAISVPTAMARMLRSG